MSDDRMDKLSTPQTGYDDNTLPYSAGCNYGAARPQWNVKHLNGMIWCSTGPHDDPRAQSRAIIIATVLNQIIPPDAQILPAPLAPGGQPHIGWRGVAMNKVLVFADANGGSALLREIAGDDGPMLEITTDDDWDDESIPVTQSEVAAILPYLQHFAAHGTLWTWPPQDMSPDSPDNVTGDISQPTTPIVQAQNDEPRGESMLSPLFREYYRRQYGDDAPHEQCQVGMDNKPTPKDMPPVSPDNESGGIS